jgi:hypothetical protein
MRVLRAALLVIVLLGLVTAASFGVHKATNPTFSTRTNPSGASTHHPTTTTGATTTTTTAPRPR